MIYEETYNFLLRQVSGTEFDVCLLSLLHTDWDGHLRISLDELARKAGTTKKYLKDIIKRFTSHAKARYVFSKVEGRDGLLYRVNISKSTLFHNNNVDRYCKKFKFFYTEEFRNLPLNAKRLVLMAAFQFSMSKNPKVLLPLEELIPPAHKKDALPLTKGRILDALHAIRKAGIKEILNAGFSSHFHAKKEVVYFEFAKNTEQEFAENYTERSLLRQKMFDAGYYEYLEEDFCIEIEKVGKYIFNSFLAKEKELAKVEGPRVSAKDELQKLARFIYDAAIKRLAPALVSKRDELNEPKKVSAYLSAIVHDLVMEEAISYSHQAESIYDLLNNAAREHIHLQASAQKHGDDVGFLVVDEEVMPIKQKQQLYKRLGDTLLNWCNEWTISRMRELNKEINTVVEQSEHAEQVAVIKERVQRLKDNVVNKLHSITSWMEENKNYPVSENNLHKTIKNAKSQITDFLGTIKDRITREEEKISTSS
ncbi:hypothetical protein U8V72_14265 [Priestia filamentosa]|uniref:hypothetical protein n=1 Tax=Priestia filamentosa TaxID=1402861 RepID=UPI0005891FA0